MTQPINNRPTSIEGKSSRLEETQSVKFTDKVKGLLSSSKISTAAKVGMVIVGLSATIASCALAFALHMPLLAIASVTFLCLTSLAAFSLIQQKRHQLSRQTSDSLSSFVDSSPASTPSSGQQAYDQYLDSFVSTNPLAIPGSPEQQKAIFSPAVFLHDWEPLPSESIKPASGELVHFPADNQPFQAWLKHATLMISTTGNIASPRFITRNCRPILVNAANANMQPGGAGTNRAFTMAVTPESWESSKEGKKLLQTGESSVGTWISRVPPLTPEEKQAEPAFLAQLLGPTAQQLNDDPYQCFQILTQGYLDLFIKARSLGSSYVQVPLISSGIYAPNNPAARHQWISAVKSSLLAAAVQFSEDYPAYPMVIVVTDMQKSPLDFFDE